MNSMTMIQLFDIDEYVSVQSVDLRKEIGPCEAIPIFGAYTSLADLSFDLELSETSSPFFLVLECRLSNPHLYAGSLVGDSFSTIFVRRSEDHLSCIIFASRKIDFD